MTADLDVLRQPTEFLDADHPTVAEFARTAVGDARTPTDRAVRLYYAVRDELRYEVYGADLSRAGLRASAIIATGSGFCVHKSIAYAAAARSVGLPSRLIFADVRNHLASDRLQELVGGNVFRYHALVSVHLNGGWVKATPVFNKLLCKLYQIAPLEFDGLADSLYHPHDVHGRRHMEFLRWHGEFDDFPYERVVGGLRDAHPRLFDSPEQTKSGSLVAEARGSRSRSDS
ncbi:MAG: transglutaminase-like domain-containing protein [Micromonosporaceae bacterium]